MALFLLCATLLLAHFVHEGWDAKIRLAATHGAIGDAQRYAPDVYRVAMPAMVAGVRNLLPRAGDASVLTLLDAGFGFAALLCGYGLTVAGLARPDGGRRALAVVAYLAAIQFPLAWVVPYQRPETMPTALYLTLGTLLLLAAARGRGWAAPVLLLLTFAQAWVRADAPCIFGAAVFLLGLSGGGSAEGLSRRLGAALGAGIAAIAGAVQVYLQFVRFPHRAYPPGTPVSMLPTNLHFHYLASLCIAVLPAASVLVAAAAFRVRLGLAHRVSVAAALLYLPLWLAVGSTAEVRIVVPFLLLLSPAAAAILSSILSGAEEAGGRPWGGAESARGR